VYFSFECDGINKYRQGGVLVYEQPPVTFYVLIIYHTAYSKELMSDTAYSLTLMFHNSALPAD
jgi:hypothetical protein